MMDHTAFTKTNIWRHWRGILLTVRMHMTIATFAAVFLLGILFGSAAPGFLDLNSYSGFSQIVSNFLIQRQTQPMAATFVSALAPNAVFWGILLLCGFCAVSLPLILLVILLKGMGYGLLASTVISQYGTAALQYLVISVLPNLLISGIALLFCCQESYRMSKSIWQMMQPQVRGGGEGSTAGEYGAKMILYGVFLCLGAAVEAYFCAISIAGLIVR